MLRVGQTTFKGEVGTTVSHVIFLAGGLTTVDSKCLTSGFEVREGLAVEGQAAQAIYKVTRSVEVVKPP